MHQRRPFFPTLLSIAGAMLIAGPLAAGDLDRVVERYSGLESYKAETVVSFLDAEGNPDDSIPVENVSVLFHRDGKVLISDNEMEVLVAGGKAYLFFDGDRVVAEFNASEKLDRASLVSPSPFLTPVAGGHAILDFLANAVPGDAEIHEEDESTITWKYAAPDTVFVTANRETAAITETRVQFGAATWVRVEIESEELSPEIPDEKFAPEKLTAYTDITAILTRMTSSYNEEMLGEPAPDFTLATVANGEPFTLSEQRGKVVVLDFWATWCPPCVESMPALQELADESGDDVVIVGMNMDQGPTRDGMVTGFLNRHNLTFTNVYTSDETAGDYNVRPIPMTVVIRPDGIVHEVILGVIQKWELRNSIATAKSAARASETEG